ncbi:MAG: YitT family protein [Clostridia bacterium]|nr:YitT family protein [Clostridia bacterium]
MSRKIVTVSVDLLFYTVGSVLYAVAVTFFITPHRITPGGITGVATTLHYLIGLPSGIGVLLLNLPIVLLGWRAFGGLFIGKTAVATAVFSAMLALIEDYEKPIVTDPFVSSVFGGILLGVGLSFALLRGATTGGVDIPAKIISGRFRHLTVGRVVLLMDGVIVAFATIAYRNLQSALYSIVAIYASSLIMDKILYGSDSGKLFYIISDHSAEICKSVGEKMHRGVTVLSATGGYTGMSRTLLLCTVRRHEVSMLYDILKQADEHAFVVVADVGEILGEGFKRNS